MGGQLDKTDDLPIAENEDEGGFEEVNLISDSDDDTKKKQRPDLGVPEPSHTYFMDMQAKGQAADR